MTSSLAEHVEKLPEFLAPLKAAAERYLRYPSRIGDDGVLDIGHRPWVAELNCMLMIYPGLQPDELARYADRFRLSIPAPYVDFLHAVNGGFFFGMSLCGAPRSMRGNTPLLNRRILQCHDLSMAATGWVHDYDVPDGYFHFGSRHYSYSANVGYFFAGNDRIVSIRGKKKIIGEWTNLTDFLAEELPASEKLEEELHPARWNA